MTRFLDVRLSSVGGDLAKSVAIGEGTQVGNYQSLNQAEFLGDIAGQRFIAALELGNDLGQAGQAARAAHIRDL